MNAGTERRGCGVMGPYAAVATACGFALALSGQALAQAGGTRRAVWWQSLPASLRYKGNRQARGGRAGKDPCSLVQALVQRETQKLVFRMTLAYGPKGNLVLRVDGPTGVALQKGLEFSPDAIKIYRLPYQACIPQQCSAVLVVLDDLKQELTKSQKGTITVYALNGQALQAVAERTGFSDGLAALDKRRPKQ